MAKIKRDYIDVIHKSTLRTLIESIVKDHYKRGEKALVKALCRNLGGLGKPGKIAVGPLGCKQYFSPHACVDVPYEKGQELFILEG